MVDDDAEVRDAIRDVLEDEGFVVRCASNGQDALDALPSDAGKLPDAIVLDLTMPVMDGYEFLARRRTRPDLAAIPVVVVTASMNPDVDPDVGFVRKPIEIEALISAVRSRLVR